jgi:5-methylcytosine-specific restriction endonuclease McrA
VIDLSAEVRRRAGDRCEYCLITQALFKRRFHIEHIVAKQHGGRTNFDNLALACWQCNLKKGPNLSAIDPET